MEEGGGHGVAVLAPVEAGVGDDEFDAADEEGEEAEGCDPVGGADERGVAGGGRCGHLGMIAEWVGGAGVALSGLAGRPGGGIGFEFANPVAVAGLGL